MHFAAREARTFLVLAVRPAILGTVGSEEVTLADVAEQGGCQEEIGSFAWFYCNEKALQDIPLDLNPISTCLEGLWSAGHTTPKMRGLSGAVGESCSSHSDCCGYCKSSGQCTNKKEDESLCNDGEECTSCYCLSAVPINGFRGICGSGGGQCGFGGSGGPGTGPTPTPCGGGCSLLGGCSSGCRCSITAGQVTGFCV
ncbi:unknown protein [Seminavis robusta]|uniref:Uncharacterized protein n=1 Tax=Seminavis robusta TaxID=568900 RepID=A0A9N8HAL4_9STRA|nr:unknown protein [Seminavis robusta]|eukprot:Sro324_g117580.1 n/a (198) ;mRNA; f:41510-42103